MNNLKVAVAGIALAFTAAASPAFAGNILWFEDANAGTSAVGGAIALTGNTSTFTSDTSTFNTLLAGGGWDLVIYGEQNGYVYDDNATALAGYIAGGGKMIGATWVDGGLDVLLEGATADTNYSTVTTSAHPIFAGLGGSIGLADPGWAVYNLVHTPAAGATGLGSVGGGFFAVILGNGGRTLLNAPLFDSYSSLSQGEQFIANQINFLTASATQTSVVPLPSAAWMGLGTLAALGVAAGLRRRRSASFI